MDVAYSTTRKCNSEKALGIDPVKLLYDRSLKNNNTICELSIHKTGVQNGFKFLTYRYLISLRLAKSDGILPLKPPNDIFLHKQD
jgi:hypothetical protein